MKRWNTLIAVCGYLRAGLLGGERPQRRPGVSWKLLVEASSYHSVAPALAWCLKDMPDVPDGARDYFDTVLALNGRRNKALLAALARIVAACNAIDIEPVPLKGAARLVERNYPAASLRFLGDLDVLIPPERAADAVAALQAIGFAESSESRFSAHHLPMLHDRGGGGGVELHTELLPRNGGKVVSGDWFQTGTRASAFGDLRIRLADATRSVGHIIAHDQLHHGRYWARGVELRQVLDVVMIRQRHEGAIDWAELEHRFRQSGFGEVLATYLMIAEAMFGQPAPRLASAPRPGAIEDFRRKVETLRLQRLASIMSNYVAARRQDPCGVKLLDWRKLPGRIRLVMKALHHTPPNW